MTRAELFKKRVESLEMARLIGKDALQEQYPDAVVETDEETGATIIRRDLRSELLSVLKQAKISQRKLAFLLGEHVQNINQFIRGSRPLPYKEIEQIMFLIGDSIYGDDEL